MIVKSGKDGVAFSFGGTDAYQDLELKFDRDVHNAYKRYVKAADADTQLLKKAFYAVILHGLPHAVYPTNNNPNEPTEAWSFRELGNQIRCPYSKNGKNRAILLLSCYSGYAIARSLARYLHLPVVAPRSLATVSEDCQLDSQYVEYDKRNPAKSKTEDIKEQNYIVYSRTDWIFCSQSGAMEIVPPGAPRLNKSAAVNLVKKYWVINIKELKDSAKNSMFY